MGMTNGMAKTERHATTTTSMMDAARAGAPLHSMDAIMALRVCGTAIELPLPLSRSCVLGRGSKVDVSLPEAVATHRVSRRHAELTRAGDDGASWLEVKDLGSSNGIAFEGVRRGAFAVSAGQRFTVADVELMVMNKLLMGMRRSLGGFVGFGDHHRLDRDIVTLPGTPLVIVGPTGSERGHLATDLHKFSPRRHRPPIELEAPDRAATVKTTVEAAKGRMVYVSLDALGARAKLATLVKAVLDRSNDVWPILVAPSWQHASKLLAAAAGLFQVIEIPPVASRGDDVPALLDLMLEEQGSPYRTAALDPERVAAMCEYRWPNNRVELRQTAARLAALIHCKGNLTAASALLREDYTTFRLALLRVGAITARARGRSDE